MHDLQSPLYGVRNALRAAVKSIRDGHMTIEDVASAMHIMDETCTTLATQVQGLLAPRDPIDAMPDEGRPERLADVVARIVATRHLPKGGSDRVVLTFERRDLMVNRPRKVERILDGLIGNALKFGPAGEAVDVCAYQHAGNLEILVVDRGPGVRPEKLTLLFRSEMRVEGLQPGETGGLGLHLASEQADALGGRLSYLNDPSGRSTFRLTIPA